MTEQARKGWKYGTTGWVFLGILLLLIGATLVGECFAVMDELSRF